MSRVHGKMDIPYKRYKTGRDALTEEEVKKLMGKVNIIHDEVLLLMTLSTGMRREDVVSIEIANMRKIDVDEGGYFYEIDYWEHKRRRTWRTRIAGRAAQATAQHLHILPKGCKFLFPSRRLAFFKTKHLASRTAYSIFQKYLKLAGLRQRPFHALRATCMKLAKKRGYTIEQLMELTGDSYRTIQQHYLTPSEDEMQEVTLKKPLLGHSFKPIY